MTKSTFTIENQENFCSNCSDKLIKHGKTKNGNQRYKCKNCQKTSVEIYHYNAYLSTINSNIIQSTKEGLGIRNTARYLKISTTTLLKRLLEIASKIIPPKLTIEDQEFQVDELRTFHKKRQNQKMDFVDKFILIDGGKQQNFGDKFFNLIRSLNYVR